MHEQANLEDARSEPQRPHGCRRARRWRGRPLRNSSGGRPTKFKPEFVEQARKLALLGATDREVAEFFEVNEVTVYRWQHEHAEFCKALKVAIGTKVENAWQNWYYTGKDGKRQRSRSAAGHRANSFLGFLK
jgi:hypothetical protein